MEPQLQELLNRIDRLSDEFSELRDGVRKAVRVAHEDPEMALIRARKVLEYIIRDVFERRVGESPGSRPLEGLVQRFVKDGHFPTRLEAYAETIRKLGNVGAHRFGEAITTADVHQSLTELLPILEWYFQNERPEATVCDEQPASAAEAVVQTPRRSFARPAVPWYRRHQTTALAAAATGVTLVCISTLLGALRFRKTPSSLPAATRVVPETEVAPAAGVAPVARVGATAGVVPATGFVSLFNGKDLSGWSSVGDPSHTWKVVDGVLEGSGSAGMSDFVTERTDFTNFHLRVETKLAEGPHSAIMFRITGESGETARYLVYIGGTDDDEAPDTGSLSFRTRRRRKNLNVILAKADPVVPIKPGAWFVEEVIADREVISVRVMGIEVARFKVLRHNLTCGAIALRCGAKSRVAFRKVEIKPLDVAAEPGAPASGVERDKVQDPFDWTRVPDITGGDWQIDGHELVQTARKSLACLAFGDGAWTDYSFSAEVKIEPDTSGVGLTFRGAYWYGSAGPADNNVPEQGSICRWLPSADPPFSVLPTRRSKDATLTPGRWHRLRIDVKGQDFIAYLDGQCTFAASDPAVARGKAGFRLMDPCRIRNVRVTAPDGTVLWKGLPFLPRASSFGVALKSSGNDERRMQPIPNK